MRYEDELRFLDHLVKGRKAKQSSRGQMDGKYRYHRKGSSKANPVDRKVSSMLQTAAGKRQAIFKITSYGKGKSKVLAHLRYISRHGKLELENENGSKFRGLDEQRELINYWALEFDTNKRSRDTLHLVLSTPPGTDRMKALETARVFLASEFGESGHEYLFVPHNDTEHPHIHAAVKMASRDGKKLNPRKAYLHEVRERFAERCREHSIDVEASPRYERGLSGKSKRSELVQMSRHDRKPHVDQELIKRIKAERVANKAVSHPSEAKMLKRNQIIRKRYAEKAKQLHQKGQSLTNKEQQVKYQQAAKLLDQYAKTMPVEATRGEKLHRQLDGKQGIPSYRPPLQSEAIDSLNQFYAVTQGQPNEQGIYISPAEKVAQTMSSLLKGLASKNQSKERGNELDIDD